MSAILSGLNLKNIYEYDSTQTYSKYDIVDFQLITGLSVYPNYTGFGQTGLTTWFNNDSLKSFATDGEFNITGWLNLISGSGDLIQISSDENLKPFVDFNEFYIDINKSQALSGVGFASNSRTVFVAVQAGGISYNTQTQKIIKFGTSADHGFIKLSGNNVSGSAKIFIDDQQYDAVNKIYDTKNIFTIVQNPSTNSITVRQNGIQIGSYVNIDSSWDSTNLTLGDNVDNQSLKYYELVHFTGVLSEAELQYYEKYLYEKYFDNTTLFYAKQNVPAGIQYAPTFFSGDAYWTQDIDELFRLSYGCSVNFTSNLSNLMMGDGYQTNIAKNVNTLNTKFNLNFDGLTDAQAKCLIAYFENTPEAPNKSLYEGFKGVNIDLFTPYKKNAELYFKTIDHATPYNNINTVKIAAESLYDSSLDYKGMLVQLDENYIRTYSNPVFGLNYNDIFYYPSNSYNDRGYYFYTGLNYGSQTVYFTDPENSPTGNNSWFTKEFYFKGEIDYDLSSNIRLLSNDSKNSTIEYNKDGINYNLLQFNVNFNKRSNSEARAILKFLDDKAGFKSFKYQLPQPYNKIINVYCPEWNHTYNFYDNNDISIKLIEMKLPELALIAFNTDIYFTS